MLTTGCRCGELRAAVCWLDKSSAGRQGLDDVGGNESGYAECRPPERVLFGQRMEVNVMLNGKRRSSGRHRLNLLSLLTLQLELNVVPSEKRPASAHLHHAATLFT